MGIMTTGLALCSASTDKDFEADSWAPLQLEEGEAAEVDQRRADYCSHFQALTGDLQMVWGVRHYNAGPGGFWRMLP